MPVRSDFTAVISRFIQDTAEKLSPNVLSQCLDTALEQYGLDRPLVVSLDVAGNGTSDIDLTSLTNLDQRYLLDPVYGLSIEYPIAATGSYPVPLFRESWVFYQKPTGDAVRLLGATPGLSDAIRFTYRASYVIDNSDATKTTVWAADFYALCKLAAAEACEVLARMFTQTVSSQPQADFSTFRSKGDEYTSRAKTLRTQYEEHIAGLKVGAATLQLHGSGYEGFSDWPLEDYFA